MPDPTPTLESLLPILLSAPGTGAVTAVGEAVAGVSKVTETLLTQSILNKTSNESKTRLAHFQALLSSPDSDYRARELSAFLLQLCLDRGLPTGNLSGIVLPVPIEVLQSLTIGDIDAIATVEQLNGIVATLKGLPAA